MQFLIVAGLLSAVTLSVVKARSSQSKRANLCEETDEPALFI